MRPRHGSIARCARAPGGFWPTPQNWFVLAVLDKAGLTESISMEAFDSLEKVFGISHTSP
jgi:hypothetical protein